MSSAKPKAFGQGNLPPTVPAGSMEMVAELLGAAKADGVNANQIWYEPNINSVVAYPGPSEDAAHSKFEEHAAQAASSTRAFTVKIVHMSRTRAQTKAVQAEIRADRSYWAGHGLNIIAIGIRTAGAVIVDVTALEPVPGNAQEELTARHGPDVDLRTVSHGYRHLPRRANPR